MHAMPIHSLNFKKRSHRAGEAGQALLFFILILGIFLLGALCLAFDFSNMWFHRQAAQTAADAACAAGAMDILVDVQGGATGHQGFALGTNYSCTATSTDSVCKYAALNGYNSNGAAPGNQVDVSFPTTAANGAPPGVPIPPSDIAGAFPFIRVDIVDHVQTFFLGLLDASTSKDVRAFSTCGVELAKAPIPIVILNPKVSGALGGSGTPTIKVLGGPSQSIQVNSDGSSDTKNPNSAVIWGGTIDLSQGGPDYNGSSLGTWGGPATYSAGVGKAFLPADPTHWMYPSPPILDPFAKVDKPSVPTDDCTVKPIDGGTCFPHDVGPGTNGCPETKNNCTEFAAGYYPGGICLGSSCGPFVPGYNLQNTAIFDPGVYYLNGGLALQDGSLVRPSTLAGDGSGGTMFYLTSDATHPAQKCSGQIGLICVGSNSGKGTGLATFDIYAAQCPGGAVVDPKLIDALKADGATYTGLTGNLLLAPCTGTYGDPSGTGQYRGMLMFADRSSSVGGGWGGGGGFLLAGSMYFHQCNAAGTGIGCGDPPADYQAIFGLQGTSGSASYVLGQIVTDELAGGGTPNIYMVLNPSTAFTILKASIFE
jgi:putative Flp pilus-assembly TadE/G-like protein